jgi:phosphoribosylglycinamide formyltransferase-1
MSERPPVKLGVLISGEGTNLQAIIDAVDSGELRADIRVVIANRANARGLERARRHGIAAEFIDHRRHASREDFDHALAAALNAHEVELVACAGFMRLLSPYFVAAFPQRILNIHPSLLPSFPGLEAQRQALEYGVKFSGCTVHLVDENLDAGPILAQAIVAVRDDDTDETLSARILAEEHRIYTEAVRLILSGRYKIEGRRVIALPNPS